MRNLQINSEMCYFVCFVANWPIADGNNIIFLPCYAERA